MLVSLNKIKSYTPVDLPTDELIRLIGSRLVEVEGSISLAPKYKNIKIVKVVSAEKIPGTHLTLCQIDYGVVDKTEQVVCGAPNVHQGMLAAWLQPGCIVPSTYGNENFKLSVRKLRGYESHGMLAAADELDLGTDHAGIIEIDPKMQVWELADGSIQATPGQGEARPVRPGDDFAVAFDLNDVILDIENKSLTHRPDCFGLIGFAREVVGISGQEFVEPGHSEDKPIMPSPNITINISDPTICPRYSCAVIDVGPQQLEQGKYFTRDAAFLAKSGMRSVSPIVDLTNIVMLETGQPLHAFDYDKFVQVGAGKSAATQKSAPQILVRLAREGEQLQLLDGETITCNTNDILITSNDVPVALAGAMGGANTAIDASTRRIILESATFSLYNMRKTQMAHGIFSEAITRFTKGQPAANTWTVLNYAAAQLTDQPLMVGDAYPAPMEPVVVKITTDEINRLLGTNYGVDLIVKTLENVGFSVALLSKSNDNSFLGDPQSRRGPSDEPRDDGREERPKKDVVGDLLTVEAPSWRTDIHIKQDIIEEVGRLLGFDNIPLTFPLRPACGTEPNPLHAFKTTLRRLLSDRLGAHEALTYSFVSDQLLTQTGFDPNNSYKITNSISPELQRFRPALTPSLLSKIRTNLKAGYHDFTLYEINQVASHTTGLDEDGVPIAHNHLSIITTGDYYQLKNLAKALFQNLHLQVQYGKFADDENHPYLEPLHSVSLINNTEQKPNKTTKNRDAKTRTKAEQNSTDTATFGAYGEIKPAVLKRFKLNDLTISALELDIAQLRQQPAAPAADFTTSKFPAVSRDLTCQAPTTTDFGTISDTLHGVLASIAAGNADGVQDVTENLLYTITPTSIYRKSPDAPDKHFSFHLEFASPTCTLQAADISDIMEKITEALSAAGATVV